ncbi:MAG: tetratricopeptide repeat protein, partial [Gemmatimonadaceae bacterium]
RGRHAEALKQLSRAIPGPTQRDTDRLYHDIAFAHLQMGNLAIARDIFLEFTRMSDNQHVALISRVNLIQVFAALGDRAEVESQRQTLEAEGLPNDLATDFFMTLGRAYLSLGEPKDAVPCFERAAAIAERAGMGRLIIESDEALATASLQLRRANAATAPEAGVDESLEKRFGRHTTVAHRVRQ